MEDRVKEYVEMCEEESVSSLKEMCKENGVRGYQRFTRRELARSCCAPILIRSQIDGDPKMEQIREKAFDAVNRLILSGGNACLDITKEQADFLRYTVERPLKVYRGISLIRRLLNRDQRDVVNSLKVGDTLPFFLHKSSRYDNCYASFSKKKSVANWYSREGEVSIVVEKTVEPDEVLVDLENLHKLSPDSELVRRNRDYFEADKEVIVIEPLDDLTIVKREGYFP